MMGKARRDPGEERININKRETTINKHAIRREYRREESNPEETNKRGYNCLLFDRCMNVMSSEAELFGTCLGTGWSWSCNCASL